MSNDPIDLGKFYKEQTELEQKLDSIRLRVEWRLKFLAVWRSDVQESYRHINMLEAELDDLQKQIRILEGSIENI